MKLSEAIRLANEKYGHPSCSPTAATRAKISASMLATLARKRASTV